MKLNDRVKNVRCRTCDGRGWLGELVDGEVDDLCDDCDGTGHPSVAQVLAYGVAAMTTKLFKGEASDTIIGRGWNACLDDIARRARESLRFDQILLITESATSEDL